MRFTKMHGAGNDYVYVNCFAETLPGDPAEIAQEIADRHFGVGGDGLILILPSEIADAKMRMFNADGTESEMCGNGIRCVAKYVFDHGICARSPLRIETGAGVLTLEVDLKEGRVDRVKVDMGQPILTAEQIPTSLPGPQVINFPLPPSGDEDEEAWFHDAGLDPRMTCVSMGNPHVVLYCDDVSRVPLEIVGPELEHALFFPKRINVHFVQVISPTEVVMRTWERGSGVTLACGTGACAVCVAGVLTERSSRRILAHLPGGSLELEWGPDEHVFMTGPATEVFTGEWFSRKVPVSTPSGSPA